MKLSNTYRPAMLLAWLAAIVLFGCSKNSPQQLPAELRDTTRQAAPLSDSRDSSSRMSSQSARSDSAKGSDAAATVPGWKTYTNEEYGFSFQYPTDLTVRPGFVPFHNLSKNWRTMATPAEKGHAIVSIPIIAIDNRTNYPRYYSVQFRIGVSDNTANCGVAGNGERAIGKITLGGTAFDQYEFSDAAMMQYVSGISYRTAHNGRCFAIEQVRTGSNYRDTTSSKDIPDSRLKDYYFLAGKIVQTFHFR